MKGVIISIAPDVSIVDVSHQVAAQDIAEAGFILESALPFFPSGSVHVVVVDPGVGTDRLPIAVRYHSGFIVGPDNGCMIPPLVAARAVDAETGAILDGAAAARIENRELMRDTTSTTFHGRDIFAPVAARLATGVPLEHVGRPLRRLTVPASRAPVSAGGVTRGRIVHVDRFGNLISNVLGTTVSPGADIEIGGRTLHGLIATYQERELAALIGSTGRLEIAVRNGSAAELLDLGVGAEIVISERK
jgi:S-adenosylmethionine hydrolase